VTPIGRRHWGPRGHALAITLDATDATSTDLPSIFRPAGELG
jgi:hypothetical protein